MCFSPKYRFSSFAPGDDLTLIWGHFDDLVYIDPTENQNHCWPQWKTIQLLCTYRPLSFGSFWLKLVTAISNKQEINLPVSDDWGWHNRLILTAQLSTVGSHIGFSKLFYTKRSVLIGLIGETISRPRMSALSVIVRRRCCCYYWFLVCFFVLTICLCKRLHLDLCLD